MAGQSFKPSEKTFLGSNTRVARSVAQPIAQFLRVEAAGGVLLILATAVALIWVNSPWGHTYHEFWETKFDITVGSFHLGDEAHPFNLELLVNDALVAIFFFVVGMEIKLERVVGQLRDTRVAALPAVAALGGMVVPAAFFIVLNTSTPEFDGWGIPLATDIAFALGVLSLLGPRVPPSLRVFLLTLAIVDDIGAILVIAIFYTSNLSTGWLLLAAGLVILVVVLRELRVWYIPLYVIVGVFVWVAVFKSGVHATIAGVVMGLLTPARPLQEAVEDDLISPFLAKTDDIPNAETARRVRFEVQETVSVAQRLINSLHPFTSYLVIPIFALANAGIEISGSAISDAASSSVTLGIILGLVGGKLVGVSGATFIAVKLGISDLPPGMNWRRVLGVAAMAGIGFTVSIFITTLAFEDDVLQEQAKLGIIAASLIATAIGSALLWKGPDGSADEASEAPLEASSH